MCYEDTHNKNTNSFKLRVNNNDNSLLNNETYTQDKLTNNKNEIQLSYEHT
jgi:hypothetical protein